LWVAKVRMREKRLRRRHRSPAPGVCRDRTPALRTDAVSMLGANGLSMAAQHVVASADLRNTIAHSPGFPAPGVCIAASRIRAKPLGQIDRTPCAGRSYFLRIGEPLAARGRRRVPVDALRGTNIQMHLCASRPSPHGRHHGTVCTCPRLAKLKLGRHLKLHCHQASLLPIVADRPVQQQAFELLKHRREISCKTLSRRVWVRRTYCNSDISGDSALIVDRHRTSLGCAVDLYVCAPALSRRIRRAFRQCFKASAFASIEM
jgi:hypothetical protein